jgi:hypothetical protein
MKSNETISVNRGSRRMSMTKDRTIKLLLFALILGVWGLLLRPSFTPTPAQAQEKGSSPGTNGIVVTGDSIFFAASDGSLYKFDLNLNLQARAVRQGNPDLLYSTVN